jgi:hypothetical protein
MIIEILGAVSTETKANNLPPFHEVAAPAVKCSVKVMDLCQ